MIHYVDLIKKCDPYPAKRFSARNTVFIIPDVIAFDLNILHHLGAINARK